MNESSTLATFLAGLRLEDVPEATRRHARSMVLDQIGCQIGGAPLPWSRPVYDVGRLLGGPGRSQVMVFGDRLPPDDAAFVNAAFGGANEIDDAHTVARSHPGAVVVPAAVAAAQDLGRTSGADLLLACVVGYEAMLRAAWAGMPTLMANHHHTPVSAGPFGAAAATAVLMGLDADGMKQALAVAGSHSGGIMEYTESGGSVKRIHTGIGAQAGLRSAYLARAGVTGPTAVLEGNRGFLEAFADRSHVDRLVDGLGETFMIDGAGPKFYFAEYRIHAPLQSLEALMAEHDLVAHDIASMRVGVSSVTVEAVGSIVEPTDALGGQFSMRFALALAARHGADRLSRLTPEDLRDADTLDLAHRVEMVVHPDYEALKWSSFGAELAITTRDGRTLTMAQTAALGMPANPFSDAQHREKFLRLTEPVLGAATSGRVLEALWSLEDCDLDQDVMALAASGAGSG